jgi:hypothetical protein
VRLKNVLPQGQYMKCCFVCSTVWSKLTNQPTDILFADKQTPTQPSKFHNLHVLAHSKILSRITSNSRIVNRKKASHKVTQLCTPHDLDMSVLLCCTV